MILKSLEGGRCSEVRVTLPQLRSHMRQWDGFQGLLKSCELRALQFMGCAEADVGGVLLLEPGTSELPLSHCART